MNNFDSEVINMLNIVNEVQPINIKCDNMPQLKALKHIKENFSPNGVKKLELLKNGVRLTDRVGAVADFIYNDGKVIMKER